MKFDIVCGDITKAKTDVIVNSLGTDSQYYGAICANIIKNAKSDELKKFIDSKNGVEVYSIYVTDSYALPSKAIMHIVSPFKWQDDDNSTNLKKAYDMLVKKAIELKYKSIAIPFIGTGANGYSRSDVFEAATSLIATYDETDIDLEVKIVVYNGPNTHSKRNTDFDASVAIDDIDFITNKNLTIETALKRGKLSPNEIARYTIPKEKESKRIRSYRAMLELNRIFLEYDLSEVTDPGDCPKGISKAFHFMDYIREHKSKMTKGELNARYFVMPNDKTKLKQGKKQFEKIDVFNYAIAAKMNVTETLIFMIYAGYSFDCNKKEDVIFHNYLVKGKLPKNIMEFNDDVNSSSVGIITKKHL